ncbi:ATP-binding sensor histidine kinase [Marinigracilibium pacificum]|uniref:histidine kinase n=1 Tax=Marinigracilibium pacificum TaxID=2729599 RepID=A0A848IVH1_9BACT|nr:ATP-binding sensor histidine kinase [Marinigracilibium pacificum]NMM47686.1 AAA family ATPase [Marinigracilibium pacificum]
MKDLIHLEGKEVNKIAEGRNSHVYYQEDSEFNCPVTFKVIREERNFYPYTTQILNEYELLRDIDIKGVRKSFGQTTINGRSAVILDYVDGLTLSNYIRKFDPPFIERLQIAISICRIIEKIHQFDIIHKDINSQNILVNSNNEVHLIDFGLATKLNTKTDVQNVSNYVAGTLAYISPEQTGRVNHVVDQRSDLYSLGVVLYELFSGQLPFTTLDPMELVHAHLAVQPLPLMEVNSGAPLVISEIVLKLLSKNMENRYQTAGGVLADLLDCYNQTELKVNVQEFKIGLKDHSDKFLTPSKLYGRDQEVESLIDSISRLGENNEISLITGYSGTGKTSLIYEVYKPLTQRKGYFIHGKFEQLQKDIPYYALVQALTYLVNLILSESEERLEYWKDKFTLALGSEGKLITDLIPNLELIIGKQKPLDNLGINEAQNRFDYTFLRFIKAIANSEHPLILFIDDMQWANSSSLHLLKKIIKDEEIIDFYFIGAYRDNEVDDAHPTALAINELRDTVKINEINLRELSQEHVREMICETLQFGEDQCGTLAKIVYDKTAGNPFFVNQFLQSIHENRLIYFHRDGANSHWKIDKNGMEKMNFTDNVVEFMIRKIEKLSEDKKEVLRIGACIGDTFDLETLCLISNKDCCEVEELLFYLAKDQYVSLLDENPDYVHLQRRVDNSGLKKNVRYKFSHDRIRQAAYAMVEDEQKSAVHLKIGEQMMNNIDPEKRKDQIFDIVFHLNNGDIQKMSPNLKGELSILNYKAALKAKSSSAYQNALSFFEKAIKLYGLNSEAKDHDLTLQMLIGAMECAYLIGDYTKMESFGNQIFDHGKTIYDKLGAYRVMTYSLIARNRYQEATNLGIEVLKNFNVQFPLNPTKLQIVVSYLKTRFVIGKKSASHFKNLPPIEDQKALAVLETILSFASAAYHVTPELFPLVIMKMLRLSLKYGSSANLISTYAAYGILLCGISGKMDDGYSFGEESLNMLKSFPDSTLAKSRTKVIFTTFISHWKEHLNKTLPILLESYQDGLESGDQEFAAGSIFVHSYHSFLLGDSLPALLTRMKDFHKKIGQLNQKSYELYSSIDIQAVLNLALNPDSPAILEGEYFDENDFFENEENIEKRKDKTALFHYHFFKMSLYYLSGSYEEALYHSDILKELEVAMSTPFIPQHVFYDSLIGLALYKQSLSSAIRKKYSRRIKANQKKLKKWTKDAPVNFSHKYLIIEAGTQHIITGDFEKAQELYEICVVEATKNHYINDLAIAYELAGDFYSEIGNVGKKAEHFAKAYSAYKNWGVAIKLKKLDNYAGFKDKLSSHGTVVSTTYNELSGDLSLVDISTIIKAASAISSEIKLKKLTHQLLKIVTQNAGAQSGVFILNVDNQLEVQAVINEHGEITDPSEDNVTKGLLYSERIIQFVKRTEKTLVIDDAQSDDRFVDDEYIKTNNCLSMLCFPIVKKKKTIGFIHLENNLSTGVFNVRRVEILKLLSGQMAVSLENAMLYDSLEQKVEERTKELEQQRNELKIKNVELINLNQEKDDLINVVSHDLRSPLNQMKGLAQIIKLETKNENVVDCADKMIGATDRLNNMITRILDISALEAKKIELSMERFDAINQIEQVVNSFLPAAKEKDIKLRYELNNDAGYVNLDKNYFIQILENLLSNAIKFSPIEGEVDVIVKYNSELINVEVKDNGPGISKTEQKMLFSKFQKLSAKPTAGEKSTGLGLSIVKRYVDAMEGEIWCESEVNNGTSFYLEFPSSNEITE